MIAELNKIAAIHLYAHGWESDDLLDFQIYLSNPSTIAQQQKLELFRSKFEISGQAPDGMLSKDYIRKTVLGLTSDEIELIDRQLEQEKLMALELDALTLPADENKSAEEEDLELGSDDAEEEPEGEGAGLEVTGDKRPGNLIKALDEDDEEPIKKSSGAKIKPSPKSKRRKKSLSSMTLDGRSAPNPIDAKKRLSASDPFISGKDMHRQANYSAPKLPRASKLTEVDLIDRQEVMHNNMTAQLKSTLKRLGNEIGIKRNNVRSSLITETGLGEHEDDEA